MNRINNNNLEALKAFYGSVQPKKAKEEKQEETKSVKEFETKKVEASALDLTAAQIRATHKVDVSDAATERRLEQAFKGAGFMRALDELAFEDDFVAYAMATIVGVDHEKLAKHIQRPLSAETVQLTESLLA